MSDNSNMQIDQSYGIIFPQFLKSILSTYEMSVISRYSTFRVYNVQILLFRYRFHHSFSRISVSNVFLEPKQRPLCLHIRNFKDFYREPNPLPKRHLFLMGGLLVALFGIGVNWPR